jgi:hypothetical protein
MDTMCHSHWYPLKTYIKDFLRSRHMPYKEEPADFVITDYVNLPAMRGRRNLRTAFPVRIIPKPEDNCTLNFRWFVQSKGVRENA